MRRRSSIWTYRERDPSRKPTQTDTWRNRRRTTLASVYDVEDVETNAWRQGCMFLGMLLICIALFAAGIGLPLIKVDAFPGTAMEMRMEKSICGTIRILFKSHIYLAAVALLICDLIVPALKFVGMCFIIWDNFFAISFDWAESLSPRTHSILVSFMYVTCSYQMTDLFCVISFVCFLTCESTNLVLCAGFYFFGTYCIVSVVMLQLLETLIENTGMLGSNEEVLLSAKRQRALSGFFPSLPGIKRIAAVDTVQVFIFTSLCIGLGVVGFAHPILNVRFVYKNIALEQIELSFVGMLRSIASNSPFFVSLTFGILVLVNPLLYSVLLAIAGIFQLCSWCGAVEDIDDCESYTTVLWVTEILRPWTMTDVFVISLFVFLFSVQNPHVVATIPFDGGICTGLYFIAGGGVAVFFLRWFWSTGNLDLPEEGSNGFRPLQTENSDSRVSRPESDELHTSPKQSSCDILCQIAQNKVFRCCLIWIIACLGIHALTHRAPVFKLHDVNAVLNETIPLVNSLLADDLPATYGTCLPRSEVPLPCVKGPPLYTATSDETSGVQHNLRHISVNWVSGLNTTTLSSVQIVRGGTVRNESFNNSFAAPGFQLGQDAASTKQFSLQLHGWLETVQIFLHVVDCKQGNISCHTVLNTAAACCDAHRQFRARIAVACQEGESEMSDVHVEELIFDPLIIRPPPMKMGFVQVRLPTQDIGPVAADSVRSLMMQYLTTDKLIWYGTSYLSMGQLLTRVVRANVPHKQFRC